MPMLPPVTPQHTNTELEEEFLHMQSWAKENRLKNNTSKTNEIVFRRPSLRHQVPPTSIVHIAQVEEVKLLGVMLTSTLSTKKTYISITSLV